MCRYYSAVHRELLDAVVFIAMMRGFLRDTVVLRASLAPVFGWILRHGLRDRCWIVRQSSR
jgi:hypothetical protein